MIHGTYLSWEDRELETHYSSAIFTLERDSWFGFLFVKTMKKWENGHRLEWPLYLPRRECRLPQEGFTFLINSPLSAIMMTQLSFIVLTFGTRTTLMLISSFIWWAVVEQIRLGWGGQFRSCSDDKLRLDSDSSNRCIGYWERNRPWRLKSEPLSISIDIIRVCDMSCRFSESFFSSSVPKQVSPNPLDISPTLDIIDNWGVTKSTKTTQGTKVTTELPNINS